MADEQDDQLDLALAVQAQVKRALAGIKTHGEGEHSSTYTEITKLTDAYARISSEIRQLQKQYRRDLRRYDDAEIVEYIQSLSDMRRETILARLSGEDLSRKPLFG
jgi:hypothetical protein